MEKQKSIATPIKTLATTPDLVFFVSNIYSSRISSCSWLENDPKPRVN
jgi:hypothetical protein